MTDIIDYKTSFATWAPLFFKHYLPNVYKAYNSFRIGRSKFEPVTKNLMEVDEDTEILRRSYLVKFVNIDSVKLSKLLTIARSHNVKLTSLLSVINLLAISPITKEHTIDVGIPVNVRSVIDHESAQSHCNSFSDKFGVYIGMIMINFNPLQKLTDTKNNDEDTQLELDWELVNFIQDNLTKRAPSSHKIFGMLNVVNVEQIMKSMLHGARRHTFAISNLGTLTHEESSGIQKSNDNSQNEPGQRNVEILDMKFSQPLGQGDYMFCCNVIGTPKGGVNLSFVCAKSLGDEVFETYVNGFERWVDHVIESS
ncbi:unnamed protein product [Ambrosiozyma monospora]|uniref:Unnamed protein product n=1 Tax=Ambrosiozyma monospora TaxID=43982 RepID=A0ACB5TB64_AMBMO|nr:unnamed protein product [Ambrosiozyma monospora]